MHGGPARPHDHAAELGLTAARGAYGPATFGDETCIQAGYREWMRLISQGSAS